jgi:hypothetical protein
MVEIQRPEDSPDMNGGRNVVPTTRRSTSPANNRAALEYLKVRLEQIPRDVLARMNPDSIERIETGLGQAILVQRQPPKASAQRRSPTLSTHFTKIGGLETEPEANVQWTGSAAQGTIPKPQKGRYGAVGQSF